jgi:hypothetical protein
MRSRNRVPSQPAAALSTGTPRLRCRKGCGSGLIRAGAAEAGNRSAPPSATGAPRSC